jgi:hypothetical protein
MSTNIDLSKSAIELDQEDLGARLAAAFPLVPVKIQRRGVIESDIETALEALNSAGGKSGAVIIVLMPRLLPEMRDAPGPRYFARHGIQVITWPPAALSATGANLTTEAIVETVIDLTHYLSLGRGNVLVFDGAEPVTVKPGRVSYTVYLRRLGVIGQLVKTAPPAIEATVDPNGILISLSCGTLDSEIWYSLDGSYPVSGGAGSMLYSEPFLISSACVLRAAANADGQQPSNIATADITPTTS